MASAATASRGRWALWAAIAILGLIALAWGALVLLLPPGRVRELVEGRISSALAREARFRDVSVSLWPPVRLTVKQPELAEPGGFGRGAALSTRSIHLDLDVWALLRRSVVVRRLVLDRPVLHLSLRRDGTTNLDGIFRPAPEGREPGGGMDLEIRQLVVNEGRALVDDLVADRRSTLRLETALALRAARAGRIETSGRSKLSEYAFGPMSAARLEDLNRSFSDLVLGLEHRGVFDPERKRLALERLDLDLGRTEVSLSGVVDEPGPRALLDLSTRGSGVDLAQVLSFVAAADARALQGIEGKGRLDFDLAIRGRLGPGRLPSLNGRIAIANGAFRYPGAPAGVEGLSLQARLGRDSLVIPNLRARVVGPAVEGMRGGAPVQASLAATRLEDPLVTFGLRGTVDLAAVSPMLAERDTRLGGRADLAVSGSGRAKDPGSIALEGRAKLAGVSLESPKLPRKIEKVAADLTFSQRRVVARGFSLAAGKTSLTLDATASRPLALAARPGSVPPAEISFTLRSPYLDLAELLPVTKGEPVLPNARGSGTVAIARLRNGRLDVQRVQARVEVTPTVLSVPSFALAGYGGASSGSARFDLADPERPGTQLSARVDTVSADALLGAWTPARGWLHGSLESQIDLSATGTTPEDVKRSLTAVGLAMVSNGTLGPGPALEAVAKKLQLPEVQKIRFRDLKAPFRVQSGRVITDPVTIESAQGRWQLTGGIGFDGTLDYAVSLTLPRAAVDALHARSAIAAGALGDEQGNLLVDLRVTGPARAPRVTIDTQAIRDRLAGKVSQAIEDQRAKLEDQARQEVEQRRAAAEDSARRVLERTRRAAEDSLRRRARDVLKGFFGASKDTAAQPSP